MPTPTSNFTTYADFLLRWGEKNVAVASRKGGSIATVDDDAVQKAFDAAEAKVNRELRGGVYAVPLTFDSYGGTVDPIVKDWIEVLAYAWLYETRGWEEQNKKGNKLGPLRDAVTDELSLTKSGVKQIAADATPVDQATALNEPTDCCRYPDQVPIMRIYR